MISLRHLALPALLCFALPLGAAESGLMAAVVDGWRQFEKGGSVMWFLLGVSIFALAIVLERLLRLRRHLIAPTALAAEADRLWRSGRRAEIPALCAASHSVLGRVISVMCEHPQASLADIRTVVGDLASGEMQIHRRRAHALTVAATLSPLLGLFGTIVGMIQAFEDFRLLGETGNPGVFAGSISLALITTAGGLIVSMPCLVLYHVFKARTQALAEELDVQIQRLLAGWYLGGTTPELPTQTPVTAA
jgi:biopolymer transport protein ExbB